MTRVQARHRAGLGAVALLIVAPAVVGGLVGAAPAASAASATGAFSKTETITRTHLVNGADQVVDTRTVTLSVNKTEGIRDRDGIRVTWSGAHPTGGLVPDPTSADAPQQEYPMVLLECRGVDSTTVPTSQRITPQTCFTQNPYERFVSDYSMNFPPWRVDRYATVADRGQTPNAPANRPPVCGPPPTVGAEYWLPFVAVNGTSYAGGVTGCAGIPPEATTQVTTGLPGNGTYAPTEVNGTGTATFDVRTAESNASLGCSSSVPCSLVAIPVMGISCDSAAASMPVQDQPQPTDQPKTDTACQATGAFAPGQFVNPMNNEDVAVSGRLWWAASNWRDRITVPLHFAPADNICDSASGANPLDIYGSELMIQATTAWAPHFCLNKSLFTFKHVQTPDPQAVNLLKNGSIEAAMSTYPPTGGFGGPVATAPIAVTGFAIGFVIDDASKHQVASLKLDARLLAKLLTESYPADLKNQYSALSGNPADIVADPEFQALNPGLPHAVGQVQAASTLLALSSDSDVMQALTSYIDADPDARAWLNGSADPWGMVVNPAYKNIVLPVNSWPLLDTYEIPDTLLPPGANDCLKVDPVPYLPLIAAPTQRMTTIALDMQYALANSQTLCSEPQPPTTDGAKLVAVGKQPVGFRFMLGVMSLGDAARFQVDAAALQTYVSPTAPAKFADGTGRTFVAPSDASMKAAARLLRASSSPVGWSLPYSTMLADSADAQAYPGTMLVSLSAPTKGLPAADARHLALLLRYVAAGGQVPGVGTGQLPAGYLPMTAANGLGAQASYTVRAATAVQAQAGAVPGLRPSTSSGGSSPTGSGQTGGGGGSGSSSPPAPTSSSATESASASASTTLNAESLGSTQALGLGAGGLLVPGFLVLAGVAVLAVGIQLLLSLRGRHS